MKIIPSNNKSELTEAEKYISGKIKHSKQFTGWTLYDRPHLNSLRPDFILVHPQKGMLIIKVNDWDLNAPDYKENAQVLGASGHYYTDNPAEEVIAYKDLILKYELDTYLEAIDYHGSQAAEMMLPVVYFHHASRENAVSFVGDVAPDDCFVWTKADLDELSADGAERDDDRFPASLFIERSKFARGPGMALQKLTANLEHVLQASDSVRTRKRRLRLTAEQYKLVPIQQGSIRRWGGVAGSGKTAVIATKAADAITKGERVLVLTYNITLRHYIRDLCSQQFVGQDRKLLRSQLTIAHFHGFLKILLVELGIHVPEASVELYPKWSMEAILKKINDEFPEHLRYDSILIDEGQEFTGDWLRFLKNVYTEAGELLVVYDEAQRGTSEEQGVWITDSDEIAGIGFKGQVGHLSITHRLPNGIVHQIDRMSELFNIEKRLDAENEQIDLFTNIEWKNIARTDDRIALIKEKIDSILAKKISDVEDITIITMNEATGINVVNAFENSDWKVSHVFDTNEAVRNQPAQNEKWMFQPGKDRLKVASYQSYKGWESSHVILLLEGIKNESKQWKHMLDALYISLTRVSAFSNSRSFTCINNCREFDEVEEYFR